MLKNILSIVLLCSQLFTYVSYAQVETETTVGDLQKLISRLDQENKELRNELFVIRQALSQNKTEIEQLRSEVSSVEENVLTEFRAGMNSVAAELSSVNTLTESNSSAVIQIESQVDSRIKSVFSFVAFGLLIAIAIAWGFSRLSAKRAIQTNISSWNKFQEYILRK
ncbi:MAG: hypothetical protein EA358_07925 [Flavobacteriales bacterium]|nr:MAG: hypothetical protein EA358_07925 [Flavobacteriales bacterium]